MKKYFVILLWMIGMTAMAQDYSLVNHNLSPFSNNPSLAGNAKDIRLALSYRQQWMKLGNHYHTIRTSYDQSIKKVCNVGFSYSYDNMANGVYDVNEFDFVYAHKIPVSEGISFRLGVEATLFLNKLRWDRITYGDQYDENTRKPTLGTVEEFDNDTHVFFDVSAGGAFVIDSKLTIGAAVFHLAEPANGFLDVKDNTLKRKLVVHANYLKDLQNKNGLWGRESLSGNYIFINGAYQRQDRYQMANVGAGLAWDPLVFGVCDKNSLTGVNTVGILAGGHFKGLQLFYVFDIFTSKKKNGSWSHELTLIYLIEKHEKYPCPVTYW